MRAALNEVVGGEGIKCVLLQHPIQLIAMHVIEIVAWADCIDDAAQSFLKNNKYRKNHFANLLLDNYPNKFY